LAEGLGVPALSANRKSIEADVVADGMIRCEPGPELVLNSSELSRNPWT
jgi:hypothetical protein